MRRVHAILHRALKQAVRSGWIASNPASNATPPWVRRAPIDPPRAEQVGKLSREARQDDPTYGLLLRLAAVTGARRGELCGLRCSDASWESPTLSIARAVIETTDGLALKGTKTHGVRRVALDRATVEDLRTHLERAQDPSCRRPEDDGRRLHLQLGARRRTALVSRLGDEALIRLRDKAGLSTTRLHELRHFSATQLLAAGVPLRTVSGRLGHATAAATLGVCAHFLPESDRDAAMVFGSMVGGS